MTRLQEALDELAARAPQVRVPRGLYRTARRRRRVRQVGAALSVVAVIVGVALIAPFALPDARTSEVGGSGSAGIPDRITMPPWWTDTVADAPPGPAAVVFSGSEGAIPQADSEDYDWPWWRPGHTVFPSVVVGLHADAYRIVRGPYAVGTELSPDGRYLLTGHNEVLDLATGRARQLLPTAPRPYSEAAWSTDGTRILYLADTVTTVLSWPSLRVEARFTHPDHRPVTQDLALSPDGSMLAVHSNQALSIYRADGTRLWTWTEEAAAATITYQPDLGRLRIAGRAAWHPDGRLAIFGRTDLRCDDCVLHPGTWKLMFMPPPDGSPHPTVLAGPSYPILRSALDVQILAWRGEDAYAVVTYSRGGTDEPGRVELIRLRPGEGAYERVLTAPAGTWSMRVATEFLDARRPAGDARYGINGREVVGRLVTGILCLAPILTVVAFMLRRRYARRVGRITPAAARP